MKKGDYEMAHALMDLCPYRGSNRRVEVAKSDKKLLEVSGYDWPALEVSGYDWPAIEGRKLLAIGYLFDNPIVAVMPNGVVCMTHAGYNTLTTRMTLTAILQEMGLKYWCTSIKGVLHCNDIPISSVATMFFLTHERKLLCVYDNGTLTEGM